MNSQPVIHVVSTSNWMAEEMRAAGKFTVKQSYGIEIPDYNTEDSWWFPQEVAVRLLNSMKSHNLPSPKLMTAGAEWLGLLPYELTQRAITLTSVATVKGLGTHEAGWWKLPEAKHESFVAEYRTYPELLEAISSAELPDESMLQFTSTTLSIHKEYRFIVVDKTITTGSLYMDFSDGKSLTYYDGLTVNPISYHAALTFASYVAQTVDAPPVYVLDVAELTDGSHVVLEANGIAFSAWYDCDIEVVADALHYFQHGTGVNFSGWEWEPDPYLLRKVAKQRPLPLH
jgi:ATP-grasp domain, R2K clade family 3